MCLHNINTQNPHLFVGFEKACKSSIPDLLSSARSASTKCRLLIHAATGEKIVWGYVVRKRLTTTIHNYNAAKGDIKWQLQPTKEPGRNRERRLQAAKSTLLAIDVGTVLNCRLQALNIPWQHGHVCESSELIDIFQAISGKVWWMIFANEHKIPQAQGACFLRAALANNLRT